MFRWKFFIIIIIIIIIIISRFYKSWLFLAERSNNNYPRVISNRIINILVTILTSAGD